MTRLRLAPVLAALVLAGGFHARAEAQSHDHGRHAPPDPHAAHRTAPAPDPHAGHGEAAPEDPHAAHRQPPPDPHAGHRPAPAQDPHAGHGDAHRQPPPDPHAGHRPAPDPHAGHGTAAPPAGPPPAEALSGPAHAADALFDPQAMAAARELLRAEQGALRTGWAEAERLELGLGDGEAHYAWDVQAWYGGDIHRLWLKSEGEGETGEAPAAAELQLLYGRAITPYFDLLAGIRQDFEPDGRTHLAFGAQGLAPYFVEVEATAFLSDRGDLTARAEAETDLRLTQRLILRPRLEAEFAARDIPERGLGAGLVGLHAGARLGYAVTPRLMPYVGVEREAAMGETRGRVRALGGEPDETRMVVGLSVWF